MQEQSEAGGEHVSPGASDAPTWAALLAHWTEFAQAAKALPVTGEGGRWKSSTAAIIGLQAVTFALADLARLKADERRLALDRARILIDANAATVHEAWNGEPLPPGLIELIGDARAALRAASEAGLEWRVAAERLIAEHPAPLVDSLLAAGFEGDLFVPTPGVPVFEGCPAVFAKGSDGAPLSDEARSLIEEFFEELSKPAQVLVMRQAYRQFDFGKGRAVRDLVVPTNAEPLGGQPLLMPAILDGKPLSVPLPIRGAADQTELPVVFSDDPAQSASAGRER